MPHNDNLSRLKGAALHRHFMSEALLEARKAYDLGEVPVGAVVIWQGTLLSRAHNLVETLGDTSAHAELLALRAASARLGEKYLTGCTLYVSLEPCPMCSGAMLWSKLTRVVFAASDSSAGACGSLFNIAANRKLNHQIEVIQGVCEIEAAGLLRQFFEQRRPSS